MKVRLVFLLFFSFAALAQQEPLYWKKDLLFVEKWPEPANPYQSFFFSATITTVEKSEKYGKTKYLYSNAVAVWQKELSYVADSLKASFIPVAQLYFDCYEYEARRSSMLLNDDTADPDFIIREAIARADQLAKEIRDYTASGKDSERFTEMRLWMDSLLVSSPASLPQVSESTSEFSVDAGAGSVVYSGPLSHYFNSSPAFVFGADLKLNRLLIDFHQFRGRTGSQQDFEITDFKFSSSDRLSVTQNSLGAGFIFLPGRRLSFAPYLSLNTFRVINRSQPEGSLYYRGPVSVNAGGGIFATLKFTPFFQENSLQYSWRLIFRGEYNLVNYLYLLDGNLLKFQLGIGISINKLKIVPEE